jgi:phosphoserine phosphatase RsbU/P
MNNTTVSDIAVKEEFKQSTEKNHIIVSWVGIALNLIWFISDYMTIPEYWIPFLYFRFSVSFITAVSLLLKKKLNLSIVSCMFILVLGISIQNAYMWSVMDVHQLQQHAFAYMVLFIGVGMLVLWEVKYSLVLLIATVIANVLFYVKNSSLTVEEFVINGGLLVFTVLVFSVFLIRNRYSLTYKEIKSRLELEKSKEVIEQQKEEVEEVNNEIKSSIRYAKRIQDSLMPSHELMQDLFAGNHFVYYRPKDIVSGDFYWASPVRTSGENPIELALAAVVDCTGHGVPGAFLSIVGSNFLKQSIKEASVNSVSEALDYLNQKIITTLNQTSNPETRVRDGMDIALIAIDYAQQKLYFSGANNPAYLFRKSEAGSPELEVLTATKQAIGAVVETVEQYKLHSLDLQKGDTLYLFSDGFPDQFGGNNNKKYNYKRFKEFLAKISLLPIQQQQIELEKEFEAWKGSNEQTDDVCIMGITF